MKICKHFANKTHITKDIDVDALLVGFKHQSFPIVSPDHLENAGLQLQKNSLKKLYKVVFFLLKVIKTVSCFWWLDNLLFIYFYF